MHLKHGACHLVVLDHHDFESLGVLVIGVGREAGAVLVVTNRLNGNAAVTPLGFPSLEFVFFHQGLHGAHRQVEQFGGVAGATVLVAVIRNGFMAHEYSKVINVVKITTFLSFYREI